MPNLSPRTWIGLGLAGIVGLFLFLIQFGTLLAIGSLGWSTLTFQGSLTAAADSLQEGDFAKAQSDFDETSGAADWMLWSSNVPSVVLIGQVPGASTAVANWQRLGIATDSITDSTGELLALYGDLSGSNGNEKIFNNGAINIERLRDLPPRVAAVDAPAYCSALRGVPFARSCQCSRPLVPCGISRHCYPRPLVPTVRGGTWWRSRTRRRCAHRLAHRCLWCWWNLTTDESASRSREPRVPICSRQ